MKLSFNLKLSQSLKLTPLLQQSIKLLQASQVEINDLINEYINDNPFIEYEEEYFSSTGKNKSYITHNNQANNDDFYDIFENQTKNLTLKEYLIENTHLFSMSDRQQLIMFYLVDAINEDGYIVTEFNDLIEDIPLNPKVNFNELESLLKIIQGSSHPGIGARDLSECLILQLENIKGANEIIKIAKIIAKDFLNFVATNKTEEISKKTGFSNEIIISAIKLIKKLNPRPGQVFKVIDKKDFINHDLEVAKGKGGWDVLLNDEEFFKIKIIDYHADLIKKEKSLRDKFQEAKWLVKNLEQRSITILRVAREVMSYQAKFLENGEKDIKPLKLKDISEKLEMHESTISRVTNNKFIKTPHGLYELKFFFSRGLTNQSNEDDTSSKSILAKLKDIVNNENKSRPLSDEKIVSLLQQEGIIVARRTIAKYRDILNILPSNQRKE